MFIDYHVHTSYSDDSSYLMEDVIKDAINLGIQELCFTDHVDYGVKTDLDDPTPPAIVNGIEVYNVDYPNYFKDIQRLQKKYASQITIKQGLEFGMQVHTIPKFQKLVDTYPMDFILLSIHQVKDKEFWTGEFQVGKTDLQGYREYYQELYDLVTQYHDYSCLAHMDLLRRYVDKTIDAFEDTKDQIRDILELVIKDGKGIEINTSSVRYGVPGLTPSIEILKLYKDMGGQIITLGSDSHEPSHLGFRIDESKQILRDLGYQYYCTYEAMKPIFHQL